ncbi:MAG TPA: complex I NDUFA9 subunit family protein, partial [Rhizomicrobium sp.]|nr:complex I NDUFA9 subunit family protein [Rhizomicrobium sp.]
MAKLVTVFGGSGFLGRNAVRALAHAGYRIRVATRYPNRANFLPPMGTVGQIAVQRCNVLDEAAVARAVEGADAVVNLVGILYPAGGQGYDAVHTMAPETIAKATKNAGVTSLVHISTVGISEDSPSKYASSKAKGDSALRKAFPDATILRSSLVAGPDDDFFNKFANLARFTPVLPLIGGGHTKFQPVFVGDVADAIVKCVEDSATRGKDYELGGPNDFTFKQMLQIILRETGRRRALIPIPFFAASIKAFFLQFLPGNLLTPDQVT